MPGELARPPRPRRRDEGRPARVARRALHGDTVACSSRSRRRARGSRSRRRAQHLGALAAHAAPRRAPARPRRADRRHRPRALGLLRARSSSARSPRRRRRVAAAADVPVINALTDDHHPCQALADLLTLREQFGSSRASRVAYIGDGNNVAHSLMEAGALAGMRRRRRPARRASSPTRRSPTRPRPRRSRTGAASRVVHDPREAVAGAHAVYTDVWVSMGTTRPSAPSARRSSPRYQVDAELMAPAAREAVFLHCLPAHRGEEVAADVIDGPRRSSSRQAANRLPTEQAVLYALHPPSVGVTGDPARGRRSRRQRPPAPRRAGRGRASQRATSRRGRRRSPSSPPSHDVVVTHGNGPQVGLLALQGEAYADVAPYPLDVLGAESEGMIGYLLDQALVNALAGRTGSRRCSRRSIVDPDDPAFARPTKPIGPVYDREARRAARRRARLDRARPTGRTVRRVVASPEPLDDRRARDDPAAASMPACSSSAPAAAASRSSPTATAGCAASRP